MVRLAVLPFFLSALLPPVAFAAETNRPPNVVFILADDRY